MNKGDYVRVSDRLNGLAGEMEVAKIVSTTPEHGLSSIGVDATREPMAEVEYNDGMRGEPFPLASFQPLLDLDELN